MRSSCSSVWRAEMAVRIRSVYFVLTCAITLLTHDTVGWLTIALVWLGHVTVTGAEMLPATSV